jgi:FtsH-binding integral membrane protein
MYLTSIGYTMFVSPVKWIVILAPLAIVFGLSLVNIFTLLLQLFGQRDE